VRKLLREFRDFIGRGNAVDLAVGLLLGSAIGTILRSFVEELLVPLTGLISKVDFSNLYLVLKGEVGPGIPLAEARKTAGVVVLGYGQFMTVLINTLVLAFAVFAVVPLVNKLHVVSAREEEEAEARNEPVAPASDREVLAVLIEIRDLLRQR
jgi:large conductance mechanosensitive channel